MLVKTALGFDEQLLELLPEMETPDGVGRLPPVDREILSALLVRRERGSNVLLHGRASLDKLGLARELVAGVKGTAYTLAAEVPERDRLARMGRRQWSDHCLPQKSPE